MPPYLWRVSAVEIIRQKNDANAGIQGMDGNIGMLNVHKPCCGRDHNTMSGN